MSFFGHITECYILMLLTSESLDSKKPSESHVFECNKKNFLIWDSSVGHSSSLQKEITFEKDLFSG